MQVKTKARARKALKALKVPPPPKKKVEKEKKKDETPSCWSRCFGKKKDKDGAAQKTKPKPKPKKKKKPPPTKLSPQMKKANNEGQSMIKNIAFPALPAIFQDLWVYAELLVTTAAFAFAMIDFFPIEGNLPYTYTYLGLTIFSMVLALFDGYVYFIELGSCGRALRYVCARIRRRNNDEQLVEEEEEEEIQGKGCFKAEWREKFSTLFELGRNLATELILYPLLVFDLFSFVTEQLYQPDGAIGRADFSLFVVGSFYLLLAVYIMRIFVIGASMYSLIQISANKKASTDAGNSNSLLIKFCLHILGQIVVHLTTVLVVGAKISNENPVEGEPNSMALNNTMSLNGTMANMTMMEEDDGSDLPNVSPFLWVVIVLGWVMPMFGIAIFFLINIYWMREFTIGFWLNMISLLQGASFAETVFGGEGVSETKDQALSFVENSDFKRVKKQLKRYQKPSFWTKFFYPTRVPWAALSGFLYDVLILTFLASIMLTYQDGVVSIVVFKDDHALTTAFLISAISILVANIHVLVLLNFLLLIIIVVLVAIIVSSIMLSPLVLCIYFPMIGVIGYAYMFKDCSCFKGKEKKYEPENHEVQKGDLNTGEVLVNKNAVEKGVSYHLSEGSVKIEMDGFENELPADLRENVVTATKL